MKQKLKKNYNKFLKTKNKKSALKKFFSLFLPEAIYRTTKSEENSVSRKKVFAILK